MGIPRQQKQGIPKYLVVLLWFVLCNASVLRTYAGLPIIPKSAVGVRQDTFIPRDTLLKQQADSLLGVAITLQKEGKFNKALAASKTGLALYEGLGLIKEKGNAWHRMASIHYYQGKYDQALEFFKKSSTSYKASGFTKGVASALNNMGAIYHFLGRYPEALVHYKKAVRLAKTTGDTKQGITTLHNIGGIYLELGELDQSKSYFSRTEKWCQQVGDDATLTQVRIGLGEIQLQLGLPSAALSYFKNAQQLALCLRNQQLLLEVLYNMGLAYKAQGVHDQSLEFLETAASLAGTLNNTLYKSRTAIAIGWLINEKRNFNQAIAFCEKGYVLAQQLETVQEQKEACMCLYEANKALARNERALSFFEKGIHLNRALDAQETTHRLVQMEFEKQLLLDSIAQVEKTRRLKAKHDLELAKRKKHRNYLLLAIMAVLGISAGIYSRLVYIKKAKARLQEEKDRSEALLLNILPEKIAEELKAKGTVEAQYIERVAILFSDFKGFTETAAQLGPQELVAEINSCFKAFDRIMGAYGLEKIKTIGDAYMAAGGLPDKDGKAAKRMVMAALDMQAFMRRRKKTQALAGKPAFDMRVGIHVGPLVAGIVGIKKFQYDVWGDTVNTASRMESSGTIGKVNISQTVYGLLQDMPDLRFEYRGKVAAKGKGELAMYFVDRRIEQAVEEQKNERRVAATA